MSIRKKTIAGFYWSFGQQIISVGINFVVSVVLARLMAPAQFGLVGMMSVFIAVGEVLMSGGMASSLVRMEQPDQRDYSSVFLVNLLVGLGVYGVVFVCAPLIARFFHEALLVSMIRVYMICILLFAFTSVPAVMLTKELDFKRLLLYRLPSLIVSGLVGIFLAYRGYGAWALVVMALVQAFLFSAVLWIKSGWMPSLAIDPGRIRNHFKFGSKLVISAVLDRFYANAYNLVFGRFYSPTELGYFARSNSLVQIPTTNLYQVLSNVSYPVLSTIQNDKAKLARAYKQLMHQALFLIIPVLTLMFLTAVPLFRVLLTDKWLPAVPYFRWLCIAGILNTVNGYNLTLLLVCGRSDLYLRLNIVEKVLVTVGLLCTAHAGVYALLYFQVGCSVVIYLINGVVCGKLIDYPILQQLKNLMPVFLVSVASGVITYSLDRQWISPAFGSAGDFWHIAIDCATYLMLYVGSFMVFRIREANEFYDLLLRPALQAITVKRTA
jgi:O-antigen/teichoic acid export membrane protein